MFAPCMGGAEAPADNIFDRIVKGKEPADVVWEDDDLIAFREKHPKSSFHVLIVPKKEAVRNPNFLQPKHLDMLEGMLVVARQLCREEAMLTVNQQRTQACIGFHLPPITSVPHLHLHCIAPVVRMSWWDRLLFKKDSFWFISLETMIARLRDKQRLNITI